MASETIWYNGYIGSAGKKLPANSYELGIENTRSFYLKRKSHMESVIVMFVTKGKLFYQTGKYPSSIVSGQYVLMDQRIEHAYWFDEEIPSEIYWMHMSGELAIHLVDSYSRFCPLPLVGNREEVLERIKTAFQYAEGKQADSYKQSSHIIGLLNLILTDGYDGYLETLRNMTPDAEFVEQFNRIMSGLNLGEASLDKICEEMNMSKYWFSHKFSAAFMATPMQYIADFKFKRAMYYLSHTSFTIQKVAEISGFSSQSYFSYSFKKEWGITPEQYRKLIRE